LFILLAFTGLADDKVPPQGGDAKICKVDDLVKTVMDKNHIPGLALAVVKDGKVLTARAYGRTDVSLMTPATADTVFRIGSLTKQFVATAIMMLVEENKLSLDD